MSFAVRIAITVSFFALSCAAPLTPCSVAPPPLATAVSPESRQGPPPQDSLVHAAGLSFAVRARPFANLAYHLDCLASTIPCEEKAFHAFWDTGWTPEDAAALTEWKEIREKYDVSAPVAVDAGPTGMPLPRVGVDVDKLLRIAALLADTVDDYRRNLRVLLPEVDAARLCRVAAHFSPRFEAFWSGSGEPVATRFRTGLEGLFAKGDLPLILARASRFYGLHLAPGSVVSFDVMVVPTSSKHSNGQQILSHGVIEVAGDEAPEDRMDVVCHELFHFFYASRTQEQQAALMKRFFTSNDPLEELAYALLDESVATALGNGVVARTVNPSDYAARLSRDMGFYNLHAIDATAKGLLTRTAMDPTLGPPLDSPETVAALVASTRDAVGADPPPLEYLRDMAAAFEPGWGSVSMKELIGRAHANHVRTFKPVDSAEAVAMAVDHASLPFVLVVRRDRLAQLAAYGDAIPKAERAAIGVAAKKRGPFAYTFRRTPDSWMFVLVADTREDAKRAADALFLAPHVTPGLLRPPL